MADFDVVVVGAGPGGSTAARVLAEAGARVCLLDRAAFPRPKACGGALSPRVLRLLPPGIEPYCRATIRRGVFTYLSRQPFEVTSRVPMGYMVRREEFDAWLRGLAEEAGAQVRESRAVRAVGREGSALLVRTGDEVLRTRMLIGADGANSLVAAQLLPRRPPPAYIGLESEVPWNGDDTSRATVLVDVGRYPRGYAWAFPKGDRVNVGVMLDYRRGRGLREALDAFLTGCAAYPVIPGTDCLAAPVAAPRGEPVLCAARGVLLVGDAAHLADPFLGEGIYSAIRSGRFAAEAVLHARDAADTAARYERAVAEAIWPDLRAASRLAALFHRMPRWWHRLLSRMPGSLLEYVSILLGEESYAGLLRDVVQRIEAKAGTWVRHRMGFSRGGPDAESDGNE